MVLRWHTFQQLDGLARRASECDFSDDVGRDQAGRLWAEVAGWLRGSEKQGVL